MSELPLYQVVGWNQYFENNKSRQRDRCGFVCLPNKAGGQGLTAVLNGGPGIEGQAMYGSWALIVEYLSRQLPPREGFLTADGTRDGMRLCAAELARMLKCPPAHVRNTLRVVCSIGWMKLVAGEPELPETVTAEVTPAVTQTVTAIESDASGDTNSDRRSDASGDTNSVLNRDTERKKERMKEPPSVPQGTETNGDTDLSIPELQEWFNSLFGRQRAWSYEEMQLLSEIWPVEKKDRALLSWAYKMAPRDKEGWVLIGGQQVSKPKQNLITLLREFSSEIDKWKSVRGNGTKKESITEPLSDEWVNALRKKFGADIPIPQSKHLLAPSVQHEIEAAIREEAA